MIKNRDAWSTIRGFVYQVDVTIYRWIKLSGNDVLELERGEDIDIVHNDINNREVSRELEQLKHRDSKISLNQDQTLEILLNFFIHKSNNPSHNLCFRFVTNASYSTERPAIFPEGKKGISVWMNLFNLEKIQPNNEDYIAIKMHLLKKIQEKIDDEDTDKEEGSEESHWKSFKEFVGKDDNLIYFIKSFEWSGSFSDQENITEIIKEVLIRKNLVHSFEEANSAYPKLFLHVFKLLCHNEKKRLTPDELENHISLTEFNTKDQQFLETINSLLGVLNREIDQIKQDLSINTEKIAQLTDDVNVIVQTDTVFDYKLKTLSLKPPALIRVRP